MVLQSCSFHEVKTWQDPPEKSVYRIPRIIFFFSLNILKSRRHKAHLRVAPCLHHRGICCPQNRNALDIYGFCTTLVHPDIAPYGVEMPMYATSVIPDAIPPDSVIDATGSRLSSSKIRSPPAARLDGFLMPLRIPRVACPEGKNN